MIDFIAKLSLYLNLTILVITPPSVYADEKIDFNITSPFGVIVIDNNPDKLNYLKYSIECNFDENRNIHKKSLVLKVVIDRSVLEKAFKTSNSLRDGLGIGKLNDGDIWASFEFEDPKDRIPAFGEGAFDFIVTRLTFASDRGSETGTGWTAEFSVGSWPLDNKTRDLFRKLSSEKSVYLLINSWDVNLLNYKLPNLKREEAFKSINLGCNNHSKSSIGD